MIAAPVAHVVLCSMSHSSRIKLSITVITIICLVAGIIFPVLASYIDILNLPADVKCATGSAGFAVLGSAASAVLIPIFTVIYYILAYFRRKKLIITGMTP